MRKKSPFTLYLLIHHRTGDPVFIHNSLEWHLFKLLADAG